MKKESIGVRKREERMKSKRAGSSTELEERGQSLKQPWVMWGLLLFYQCPVSAHI